LLAQEFGIDQLAKSPLLDVVLFLALFVKISLKYLVIKVNLTLHRVSKFIDRNAMVIDDGSGASNGVSVTLKAPNYENGNDGPENQVDSKCFSLSPKAKHE
jgi:hypothetical protein